MLINYTATLDRERGVANLYLDTDTAFTPTQGSAVKLTSAMKSGLLTTYNFSRTTTSITYTGTTNASLRVSASMVFSQGNGNQIIIYIAKNDARLGLSPSLTGAFQFMPSALALARPLAFKPPDGDLPSLRCQAGVFISLVSLQFWPQP